MKIIYPPSEKTLQLIETIREMREKDPMISASKISRIVNLHQTYISALIQWDKEHHEKKGN